MDDPGFDYSVLSEFRDRLAQDDRADRLLALMVERLAEAGLVGRRGRVRTDSTHVLAAVRRLNRVELVGETLRAALEELAVAGDEWLAAVVMPDWGKRYGRPVRYERLPRTKEALSAYVLQVGEDGIHLMSELFRDDAPPHLRLLPQVRVLRQAWVQQYVRHVALCFEGGARPSQSPCRSRGLEAEGSLNREVPGGAGEGGKQP
ncbi:Clp family protein [Streptomyces sp. NBRC 110611]|uniref:hypothetical protein n=1 Tax=Streptomyces sp. NBRC 110611 TaxID=1621259 RepID=UPI00082B6973|nr:hypothetical protein [Streptomyces sp. NBRC 110611]GAU70616.1 Clp family protein [Streptomyces sp. NBRC 110611]